MPFSRCDERRNTEDACCSSIILFGSRSSRGVFRWIDNEDEEEGKLGENGRVMRDLIFFRSSPRAQHRHRTSHASITHIHSKSTVALEEFREQDESLSSL